MKLAFLMYIIDVLEVISFFSRLFCALFLFVIISSGFFLLFKDLDDDERQRLKRAFKKCLCIFVVLSVIYALVPNEKRSYMLLEAYFGSEAFKNLEKSEEIYKD